MTSLAKVRTKTKVNFMFDPRDFAPNFETRSCFTRQMRDEGASFIVGRSAKAFLELLAWGGSYPYYWALCYAIYKNIKNINNCS